jgi:phosphopantetheinyl transferase (holo-ACP synthase)
MLGNDLIDLRDFDARPETFRPGFDERVFSYEERQAIAGDRNPLARRWAHWGAKEAAYKLARQIDSEFVFSPSRLVAVFESEIRKSIEQTERRGRLVWTGLRADGDRSSQYEGCTDLSLELRSFETAERIHVIAVPTKTDWDGIDSAVSRMEDEQADSSAAVRALAVREIGRRMGVAPDRISIGRRGKIPTVLLDGELISLSLSLSHHGGWVGYATGLCVAPEKSMSSSVGGEKLRLLSLDPTTPIAPLISGTSSNVSKLAKWAHSQ